MDTVLVLMNEVPNTWWAMNQGWVLPIILQIMTILVVVITTRSQIQSSRKSTEEQIEESRKSTEKQIKSSTNNTNKQIENQNREGKRPLITVRSGKLSGSSLYPIYYFRPFGYDVNKNSYAPQNKIIEFKNIGYGVALDLRFKDISIMDKPEKYYISNNSFFVPDEENDVVFIDDLECGEEKGIKLQIEIPSTHKVNKDSLLKFSLIYSDLNENYYESIYIIGITTDFYVCRHIHLPGTEAYNKKVAEIFGK